MLLYCLIISFVSSSVVSKFYVYFLFIDVSWMYEDRILIEVDSLGFLSFYYIILEYADMLFEFTELILFLKSL